MSLKGALEAIEKKHGKEAVSKMSDRPSMGVELVPSGNIQLDVALGGGYPKGRIVEIYGPESSGKTTMALHAVAEAQKAGGKCLFIDAEHALDPVYAEAIGVDVDELFISQPESGEDALDIALEMIRSEEIAIIVVDSVAALTPRAEIAGDIGDSHVGLQARMMSQAMRKMRGIADETGTIVIFINQLREKIGVMFGSPETTPGGRALKFYASVRLDIRRIGAIKQGVEIVGNQTKVKVVKNKIAPPFKIAEFDIMYGEGASQAGSVLDLAVEEGLIKKSGAWYADATTGEKVGQGREAGKLYLQANPEYEQALYDQIKLSLFPADD
jgi:recombination protein RecA